MDGDNDKKRLMNIHKTSIVHSSSKISDNVEIGAFCIIDKNVEIGSGTLIYPNVHIMENSIIGKNNIIHNGAIIGSLPQDLKFKGENTKVVIGDNNVIREYVTINRGTTENGVTSIGNDNLLMAYVHVAHDCILDDKIILANAVQLAGHVEIGFHATIGGITGIHQFCKIGSHVFIGGGFRAVQDVPPYILAVGEPLRFGGINSIGLKRRGFSIDTLSKIKKAYKIYFRSDLTRSKALDKIKNSISDNVEVNNIFNFIDTSERGII